jgi:hypothetical protein
VDPHNPRNRGQTEWAVLEALSTPTLEGLMRSWDALTCCSDYQVDAPVNLAVRVAREHGAVELEKRRDERAFGQGSVSA